MKPTDMSRQAVTTRLARTEQAFGPDAVLGQLPMRFGLGFMLRQDLMPLSPSHHAFGHPGAGGSHAFADPENGIAFAYVMNQMELGVMPNEKSLRMIGAIY